MSIFASILRSVYKLCCETSCDVWFLFYPLCMEHCIRLQRDDGAGCGTGGDYVGIYSLKEISI